MEASTLHKLTSKVPTLTRKLDLSKLEVSFPYPLSPTDRLPKEPDSEST